MRSVILCAKPTRAFPQGDGSLAQFLPIAIVLKSVLDGYRLCGSVRDNGVTVDTKGKLVQALTIAAEVVFENGQVRVRRSLTVCAPSVASFSPVTWPTPGKRPTATAAETHLRPEAERRRFRQVLRPSEASFAKNLLGAAPAEAVRFNSSRICKRIVRATSVAVANPLLFSVRRDMLRRETAVLSSPYDD